MGALSGLCADPFAHLDAPRGTFGVLRDIGGERLRRPGARERDAVADGTRQHYRHRVLRKAGCFQGLPTAQEVLGGALPGDDAPREHDDCGHAVADTIWT